MKGQEHLRGADEGLAPAARGAEARVAHDVQAAAPVLQRCPHGDDLTTQLVKATRLLGVSAPSFALSQELAEACARNAEQALSFLIDYGSQPC
jgi:hypothetical protein